VHSKGEVNPETRNEGPEGEYMYSSTLSLTSERCAYMELK